MHAAGKVNATARRMTTVGANSDAIKNALSFKRGSCLGHYPYRLELYQELSLVQWQEDVGS